MRALRALAAVSAIGLVVVSCSGETAPPEGARTAAAPRLGVLVVVDQLRGDLLQRYDDAFTGGFRRLLDDGAVFTNATHDHATTATAPGHTTVGTGRMPRHHGIAGNSWYEKVGEHWRSVYAVADTAVRILADPGLAGRSPANIRVDAIGDWVRAADSAARVIGISRKDRGAIPLTGHTAQDAYWMALTDGVGGFTTSTYYHDTLPEWVRDANEILAGPLWGDTVWTYEGPDDVRGWARPDENVHEADGVHTTLPHRAHAEVDMFDRGAWGNWLEASPAPDAAVTTLATHALRALDLGARGSVDLLALSFSSTDGVGHTFGPLSQEQLANLLRLDRQLDIVMDSLDARVGVGRWTLALTADHGVMSMPEWREEHGMAGHRLTREERRSVNTVLDGVATGDGGEAAAAALSTVPFVADAYSFARLRRGVPADSFETLFRNSFVEDRVPGYPGLEVAVRRTEGTISNQRGAGHGSAYHYDRWVPFIVYGAGVEPGVHPEQVATFDIAPTLADLMGVPIPDDVDGQPRLR